MGPFPTGRSQAAGLAACALFCLAGCAPRSEGLPKGPLTTVEQVRQLTPEAVAAGPDRGTAVDLQGTVAYEQT